MPKKHKISSKLKIAIYSVVAVLATLMLVAIYALGPLKTFLPNICNLTGTIFGSRTYLILFQNNYEIRPTGGFISAYGVLTINHGIPGIQFYDVYGEVDEHEYIDPPHYPMQELLGGPTYGGYTFRDTNYYVDFRDSAQEMLDFYHITQPESEIDGIVAIDFTMLESLVGLYGPVKAGDFELTKNNLFETLSAEVSDINRHDAEEIYGRKDIMKDVAKDIIKNAILSPFKYRGFSALIAKNLDEKHVILWFADEGLESKAIRLGWSGTMPEDYEDLLAVSEANLGGMKNDRYMARNIKYEVDIQEDQIVCNLEVTMDHFGGENIPLSGDYKGYLRAYIPSEATQITDKTEESKGNYKSLGEIIYLSKTEEKTVEFEYTLPISIIEDGTYSLDLVKQPGTEADNYEIIIHTPQGSTLESESFTTHEEHAYLSTGLSTDQRFELTIIPDETEPRIHSHEIVELNKIWIGFNEPLDCDTASDPFAYAITDTNTAASETDTVYIDTITCSGRDVWLDTIGMTSQNEEFYEIILRNIRDKAGNYIDPNPRTITVVQRGL